MHRGNGGEREAAAPLACFFLTCQSLQAELTTGRQRWVEASHFNLSPLLPLRLHFSLSGVCMNLRSPVPDPLIYVYECVHRGGSHPCSLVPSTEAFCDSRLQTNESWGFWNACFFFSPITTSVVCSRDCETPVCARTHTFIHMHANPPPVGFFP